MTDTNEQKYFRPLMCFLFSALGLVGYSLLELVLLNIQEEYIYTRIIFSYIDCILLSAGCILLVWLLFRFLRRYPKIRRRLTLLAATLLVVWNVCASVNLFLEDWNLPVTYRISNSYGKREEDAIIPQKSRRAVIWEAFSKTRLIGSAESYYSYPDPDAINSQDLGGEESSEYRRTLQMAEEERYWSRAAFWRWKNDSVLPVLSLYFGNWTVLLYLLIAAFWSVSAAVLWKWIPGMNRILYTSCMLPLALSLYGPILDSAGLIHYMGGIPFSWLPNGGSFFGFMMFGMVQLGTMVCMLCENRTAGRQTAGKPELPVWRKLYLLERIAEGDISMRLTLERFRSAQEGVYEIALEEIRAGKKTSHWIWFVFPQLQGLGRSNEAWYFGIQDREEALAYMRDPLLSARLLEISEELLKKEGPIEEIVHFPDNLKIRSCMTLFHLVSGETVFKKVLDQFFEGSLDEWTVNMLSCHGAESEEKKEV